MSRRPSRVPAYKRHRNEARCWAFGRWVTLGVWQSPESLAAYRRVCAEVAAAVGPAPPPAVRKHGPAVADVLAAFRSHAQSHYRHPDGTPTTELKELGLSLRPLCDLYGPTPAAEFGPLALAAVRAEMVRRGWCRTLVNRRVERVKRVFKWAAAQELVPVAVHAALATVAGLRKGRSNARESRPVEPVDPGHYEATLVHLHRHAVAILELMRWTGMRPGEACRLRLGEVDRSGEVWVYRPGAHKTAHRGKGRAVPIGPRGQRVLVEFFAGREPAPGDPVFSPAAAREERMRVWRAGRKSRVQPSQADRRKASPRRRPGGEWKPHALAHAVRVAAEKAGVPHWHPHQLRHLVATEVRASHGLEAAQALLGHDTPNVTLIYAEKNLKLASEVAREVG